MTLTPKQREVLEKMRDGWQMLAQGVGGTRLVWLTTIKAESDRPVPAGDWERLLRGCLIMPTGPIRREPSQYALTAQAFKLLTPKGKEAIQ